ncbi:MAG: hypothetical protein LBP74_04215 [Treponema sp.]|nr:hypothetical protein [Treponema sp.]
MEQAQLIFVFLKLKEMVYCSGVMEYGHGKSRGLPCSFFQLRELNLFDNPVVALVTAVSLQVLQNVPHFAVLNGCCSETEVSKQLY